MEKVNFPLQKKQPGDIWPSQKSHFYGIFPTLSVFIPRILDFCIYFIPNPSLFGPFLLEPQLPMDLGRNWGEEEK